MINILGEPERTYRSHYYGSSLGSEWPEYTVTQAFFQGVHWHDHISDEIGVVGFEEWFLASDPPKELRTPSHFASPEILFLGTPGYASDVWALACTIWTIRTGSHPFKSDKWNPLEFAVWNMEYFLGLLPEPYKTSWAKCQTAYKRGYLRSEGGSHSTNSSMNDIDRQLYQLERAQVTQENAFTMPSKKGARQGTEDPGIPKEQWSRLNEEYEYDVRPQLRFSHCRSTTESSPPNSEYGDYDGLSGSERPKWPDRETQPYCTSGFSERVLQFGSSFERELAKEWKGCHRDPTPYESGHDPEKPNWVEYTWRIPDEETIPLADLVSRVWKYDPSERVQASTLINHVWFQPLRGVSGGEEDTARGQWLRRLRPRKGQQAQYYPS